jgi:hypothetical protein
LRRVAVRLRSLREELRIADEQLVHLRDEAEETSMRAIVADTSHAAIEHRRAQEHVEAMVKHRAHLQSSIAGLEVDQDRLLDELNAH